MPPKKAKKPRPKKNWQKLQDFIDDYRRMCKQYDALEITQIGEFYDPFIGKRTNKIPQTIQLSKFDIQPAQIAPVIATLSQSEFSIKQIGLVETNSGDEGFKVLAGALDPPLETSAICYMANNVSLSGCRFFARKMVLNKSLATLELDFNPSIGDEGVIGLTHYGTCPSLTYLSLRFCGIGDNGAIAIGKWLALEGCNIVHLSLNGNKIGPPGAVQIGDGMGKSTSLNRVELDDNLFGFDLAAMEAIHDGILASSTIQFISIACDFDVPEGIPEKFYDLTQNKGLGECKLSTRMDPTIFTNTRALTLLNSKKIAKEMKRIAREMRKHKGGAAEPPAPTEEPASIEEPAPAQQLAPAESPVPTEPPQEVKNPEQPITPSDTIP